MFSFKLKTLFSNDSIFCFKSSARFSKTDRCWYWSEFERSATNPSRCLFKLSIWATQVTKIFFLSAISLAYSVFSSIMRFKRLSVAANSMRSNRYLFVSNFSDSFLYREYVSFISFKDSTLFSTSLASISSRLYVLTLSCMVTISISLLTSHTYSVMNCSIFAIGEKGIDFLNNEK